MTTEHLSFDYRLGMVVWLVVGVLSFWTLLSLRRRFRRRRRRMLCVHAALSLWFLCAILTCVEIYFATIYDQTDSFSSTNVSKKWFQLHIDPYQKVLEFQDGVELKYRNDVPYPESLQPQQYHICFLGDSFTFGHGVPDVADRFSNRVAAALQRDRPGKFVVSNLAKAGTSLHWVARVLEKLLRDKRRIDTLVYVLCLNDIETFHTEPQKFYDALHSREPQFFLLSHTYFLNLLYYRLQIFTRPEIKDYYGFVRNYYSGEPWEKMKRLLRQMARDCRERNVDFRIVVFPFLHQLGEDYEFRAAHKKIVAFCGKTKIPVLDLDPVLSAHASDGLTVNRFDAHPNERANELAARAILKVWKAEWLKAQRDKTEAQSHKQNHR